MLFSELDIHRRPAKRAYSDPQGRQQTCACCGKNSNEASWDKYKHNKSKKLRSASGIRCKGSNSLTAWTRMMPICWFQFSLGGDLYYGLELL